MIQYFLDYIPLKVTNKTLIKYTGRVRAEVGGASASRKEGPGVPRTKREVPLGWKDLVRTTPTPALAAGLPTALLGGASTEATGSIIADFFPQKVIRFQLLKP